jgi:hypothetical protein
MRAVRCAAIVCCSLAVFACGCGSKQDAPSADGKSDEQLIQEALTEAITRWHYGDRAALYDNEFEYLQERVTFDRYLTFGELSLDADTVEGINAKAIQLFGRDSALVDAEIVFKGPTGKITLLRDATTKYMLYYHRGRWIRPTMSRFELQQQYEHSRHAADSAAEAEARELGDD